MRSEIRPKANTDSIRPSLSERYLAVRSLSEALARPIAEGFMARQTMPEVSPTKWHLAHVTWFFERMVLAEHQSGFAPHDERYWYLFNSYYNSMGPMHPRAERGRIERPDVSEVLAYRAAVDAAMLTLIAARGDEPALAQLIELGLNHEQQHQELLLTDILHVLSQDPARPAYRADLPLVSATASAMGREDGAEGVVEIGAAADGGGDGDPFTFDNETPRHRTYLQRHALADRLVVNAEYRAFIEDGAYRQPSLWMADGWAKIREAGWSRPLYWSEHLSTQFTLGGERELDPHAAVSHLSYYEADAFARWAGARLPTEAEWEHAAAALPVDGNLLDAGRLQTGGAPAKAGDGTGLRQVYGDVWEWTASAYAPYPGFRPLAGSLGEYNGKFMCNQMSVRGGSCLTSRDHVRASYRSFFYPHDRWQALGLRLAYDA